MDEPLFTIRAKDVAGPAAVEAWALLAEAHGADAETLKHARDFAGAMREWQWANPEKVKVPDHV